MKRKLSIVVVVLSIALCISIGFSLLLWQRSWTPHITVLTSDFELYEDSECTVPYVPSLEFTLYQNIALESTEVDRFYAKYVGTNPLENIQVKMTFSGNPTPETDFTGFIVLEGEPWGITSGPVHIVSEVTEVYFECWYSGATIADFDLVVTFQSIM